MTGYAAGIVRGRAACSQPCQAAPAVHAPPLPGHSYRGHSTARALQHTCRWWKPSSRGTCIGRAAPFDLDELDTPAIDADLRSYQEEAGAQFSDDDIVQTFGNDRKALAALESGAVLVDRSHWGRLRVSGEDRLTFLHGQSTNDFKRLRPGQGCDTVRCAALCTESAVNLLTLNLPQFWSLKAANGDPWQVFVTAQGRTLELASCYVQGSGVLVVVSQGMKQALLERLDKYIFPGDKVAVQDVSDRCCMLSLAGLHSHAILSRLGAQGLADAPHGSHQLLSLRGSPVIVAQGSGLASPGFTLIADEAVAGELWSTLVSLGAVPMGEEAWERVRVIQGRPAAGAELTEDYNPLEAGLFSAVSVDKGCYIGQETLAKVANLNAVKQQLWGIELAMPVRPGDTVTTGGERLGRVTSVATRPDGTPFALAYLRSKSRGAALQLQGLQVEVAGVRGTVVPIPFATRAFAGASEGSTERAAEDAELTERSAAARQAAADAAAAAEDAKAARLAAMQERLAAWQAQQAQQAGSAAPDSR